MNQSSVFLSFGEHNKVNTDQFNRPSLVTCLPPTTCNHNKTELFSISSAEDNMQ